MISFYRGTTVNFAATFQDVNGNVIQPSGAAVNIVYFENGEQQAVDVEMNAPMSPGTQWTAEWDSRSVTPGPVTWSIHSKSTGIPYAVQDGTFQLLANSANLETF